jgi:hypothetical protein
MRAATMVVTNLRPALRNLVGRARVKSFLRLVSVFQKVARTVHHSQLEKHFLRRHHLQVSHPFSLITTTFTHDRFAQILLVHHSNISWATTAHIPVYFNIHSPYASTNTTLANPRHSRSRITPFTLDDGR